MVISNGTFAGNDKDRLVHWCHGAPGVTLCLLLAHQVWGCETDSTWSRLGGLGRLSGAGGCLRRVQGCVMELLGTGTLSCTSTRPQGRRCGCTGPQCSGSGQPSWCAGTRSYQTGLSVCLRELLEQFTFSMTCKTLGKLSSLA